MSSHHIVREKQEPALLVLSLDDFDAEHLGQLLEWSPTVITTMATAEELDTFGIKIDLVVGRELDTALQSAIKLIPLNDHTPLNAALLFLISAGYPAVNIITDHFNAIDYVPFTNQINLVIFADRQKIYPVKTGYSKWKPAHEIIHVFSNNNLTATGLKKAGNDQYITLKDGFITLIFENDYLFIAENF